MPWIYPELPTAIQLPPCPACANRGRVTQVARHTFVCTDCRPARVFVAIFRQDLTLVAESEKAG